MMTYYFITGSSRGIGRALCEFILQSDAHAQVHGFSRNSSIEHERYTHHSLDFSKSAELKSFSFPDLMGVGKIVLVNNAGTLGDIRSFDQVDEDQLIDAFEINLIAPALLCRKFVAKYRELNIPKVILNISTGAAFNGYEGWSLYCSSKAGLEMWSTVMRKEEERVEASKRFEILSIQPGVVDTAMQDKIRDTDEADFPMVEKFHKLKNDGALYDAHDVAQALLDIIHDPSQLENWQHRIQL